MKFKLYYLGEFVGYEKWELETISYAQQGKYKNTPVLCLRYSYDNVYWHNRALPHPQHEGKTVIVHDKKELIEV